MGNTVNLDIYCITMVNSFGEYSKILVLNKPRRQTSSRLVIYNYCSSSTGKKDNVMEETKIRTSKIRKKIVIDLSPEAYKCLQTLRQRSEATSNAGVIKNALRFYDYLMEQKQLGGTIQIVTKKGVKDVEFLF